MCIVSVIRENRKLDGVPRKSSFLDVCLGKEHALTEQERRHPQQACPSSSYAVGGLRSEKQ